ncbi:MAG: cytochrome b/b6 domain-containing protein [Pseudomonadota bacterium]
MTSANKKEPPIAQRPVWDILIRLWHWLLVVCLAGSWASAEFDRMQLHFWFGYGILGLMLFRVFWGFVGTRHARFSSFLPKPQRVIAYIQSLRSTSWTPSVGHSPIGALAVFAILAVISAQVLSGLFTTDDIFWAGPYNPLLGSDASSLFSSVHRINFNVIKAIVVMHIAAVLSYWFFKSTNLIKPMFTGQKPANVVPEQESAEAPRWRTAILAVGLSVVMVLMIVWFAPEPVDDFF